MSSLGHDCPNIPAQSQILSPQAILSYCQTVPLNAEQTGPADPKGWVAGFRDSEAYKSFSKEEQKKAMPFASFMVRDEVSIRGPSALDLELPFDEAEMLAQRVDLIKFQLQLKEVEIRDAVAGKAEGDDTAKADQAQPAKPTMAFLMA